MTSALTTKRHWSEDLALEYLASRGLRLVCRNYRTRRGEIDLVMRDMGSLIFVEVRYRSSTAYGRPEETVGLKKQGRLRLAARHFLAHHPECALDPCRFDILAITGHGPDKTSRWIPNAF